jgi:hypothetical protein
MADEYPLYPKLSEEGFKEAELLFEDFRNKLKGIAEDVCSHLYTDIMPYIETDSWTNFRNELLAGFSNYGNRKIQGKYDFDKIRRAIFDQFRDEIMLEMPEELKAENQRLQEEITWMRERRI